MTNVIKCDNCSKNAICNYQDVIVRYTINEDREYIGPEFDTEFDAGIDVNKHFCEKHEEEWLNKQ